MNGLVSALNKVLISEGPDYDKKSDGKNVCIFKEI
jgi:hypothetical protein